MIWLLVLIALILLGALLSWTATRLDRMNHRVETAAAALDAALARRAAAALEMSTSGVLDPATALLVADAAHRARAAGPEALSQVQTDLTHALRAAVEAVRTPPELTAGAEPSELPAAGFAGLDAEALADLRRACSLVAMARRLHNDAVAQTLSLRGIWVVRWFGLAGHSRPPSTVDFDDTVGLDELPAAPADGPEG